MKIPTLEDLDKVRKEGFRPSVVCCFIHNGMVLFLHRDEYHIWMLPQGRINNKEEPMDALSRTIEEEMGSKFLTNCNSDVALFGEDLVEFLPEKYEQDGLTMDTGEVLTMKGKKYYFFAVTVKSDEVSLKDTPYNDYFWLDYRGGLNLARKIHQSGKRRITSNILNQLHEQNIVI